MKNILVINDEPDLLEVCQLILEGAGYLCRTVAHAHPPLLETAVQEVKPDLILLDLVMPTAPGEQVARWLRSAAATRETPLVIMSALSEGPQRAKALGAARFLPKPFGPEKLLETVGALVR
jgi:CheY-like chemotaxis protein